MTFQYVNWQPDDEVTSAKLKQMADNEQQVYDDMITGDVKVALGINNLVPDVRQVGTTKAKKIEGILVKFDSLVPTARHTVYVPFNNIFTTGPLVVYSIRSQAGKDLVGQMIAANSTEKMTLQVFRRDLAAVHMQGEIHAIAIGY